MSTMQAQSLVGPSAKSAAIKQLEHLLQSLESNLETLRLSLKEQQDALSRIKALGRDVKTATPIFNKQAISVLSRYGLDAQETSEASREALRCLANAFLLHEPSRQVFVDLGYAPKAAERLKGESSNDEFLVSRILFYLTYGTDLDFNALIDHNGLAGSINLHIARHAKLYSKDARRRSTSTIDHEAAMSETCKLMFNITYHYPDSVSKFTPVIEPLITALLQHTLPEPPLQPPTSYLLNALLNLDLKAAESDREAQSSPMFPSSDAESFVDRLISILDSAIRKQPESELDQAAAPLCTLLRRLYELATPPMKEFMRSLLLPKEKDRERPLGQGDTLSSRLLRLSNSPKLPNLRGNISALLFEMSDKDATKFVQNIGYGFASGFLMSQNIEIPSTALEANSAAQSDYVDSTAHVNPVTGQRWAAEDRDASNAVPMSEEEKEREAERLFVLFERLKATGVVNVKNPVERRFEEVE
ncbi:putative guanine nucleotide exchange factor, Ric8 [Septoria linicola]|nr:putative guanine nucleotide exchange factor, Ric8 [Septoria linicola]